MTNYDLWLFNPLADDDNPLAVVIPFGPDYVSDDCDTEDEDDEEYNDGEEQ